MWLYIQSIKDAGPALPTLDCLWYLTEHKSIFFTSSTYIHTTGACLVQYYTCCPGSSNSIHFGTPPPTPPVVRRLGVRPTRLFGRDPERAECAELVDADDARRCLCMRAGSTSRCARRANSERTTLWSAKSRGRRRREKANALSTMETMPVRFPGMRMDVMIGDVEPLVSRVMKRRWELAACDQ
jgi:hypothetical protein